MKRSLHRSGNWFGGKWKESVIASCLLLLLEATVVFAQSDTAPRGWILAGDHPQNYVTGIDKQTVYQGHPSAYLKAKPSATEGFGTLMQQFDAAQYAGKRVRLSGWVKSENVDDWAGLWMRVDRGRNSVAFDNMQNRAIKGNNTWQNYAVVLDVPKDATGIAFGVLVSKNGTVWLNSVRLETVGMDVPVTDMRANSHSPQLRSGPTNLDFEE
jgi:hypothetical protein